MSAPGRLSELRDKHPEAEEVFRIPELMGSDQVPSHEDDVNEERRNALLDLSKEAILETTKQLEGLLEALTIRRQMAERLRLLGGLVAAFSGVVAGAAAAFSWGDGTTSLVASVFSAAGGITTLLAGNAEKAPSGISVATAEEFGRALEMRAEALLVARRLNRESLFPLSPEDFSTILTRSDEIAAYVLKMGVGA